MDDLAEPGDRWVTFAELAALRGTSKRAAVMLVRRHGWRRQRNNAGHTLALVPATWLAHAANDQTGGGSGHSADYSDGQSSADVVPMLVALRSTFDAAMSALREGHEREMSALQAAHAGDVRALRSQLAEAETARDQARAEARDAREAANDLRRREATWWQQGRWARLRAAWRGL